MKFMRKFSALMLCFAMISAALPVWSSAAEENIFDGELLFYDTGKAEDLRPSEDEAAVMAAEPEWVAEFAVQLRDEMKRRNGVRLNPEDEKDMSGAINFKVQLTGVTASSSKTAITSALKEVYSHSEKVQELAIAHTGVPDEGDYILWHLSAWGRGASADTYGDGTVVATLYFFFTYHSDSIMEAEVEKKSAELLNELNLNKKTDYQKVRAIYDWICNNVVYDDEHVDDETYSTMYTAYGALIDRTAVCQGYANLFYRLALAAGVDCRFISGTGRTGSGSESHGWNIVKLGELYYNVDSTWDAPRAAAGYDYDFFLKHGASTSAKDDFNDSHVRDSDYNTSAFKRSYPMSTKDYVPDEEPVLYVINSVSGEVLDEDGIYVDVSLTGGGAPADLIVAVYRDGALVDMNREDMELAPGETVDCSYVLKGDLNCTLKAFVWDSVKGIQPLSQVVQSEVKEVRQPQIQQLEVIVAETYVTRAATDGKYYKWDKEIGLVAPQALVYNNKGYRKGELIGYFDEGDTNAADYLGKLCLAELESGIWENKILSIEPVKDKNTVVSIRGDRLADEGDLRSSEQEANENGYVFYWENLTDVYPKSVKLDRNVRVFLNYSDKTVFVTSGTDLKDMVDDKGLAEFTDCNGDGEFDFVMLSAYSKEGVVAGVKTDGRTYTFTGKTGAVNVPEKYDPADTDVLKLFVKDGKFIEPGEIASGDTVTTVGRESKDVVITYRVSSDSVTGDASRVSDDEIRIGNKYYELSPLIELGRSDIGRVSGVFFLNADGLISGEEPDVPGSYGFIVELNSEKKFGRAEYTVKLMDSAGKVKEYTMNGSLINIYSDNKIGGSRSSADKVYSALEDAFMSLDGRVIKYQTDGSALTGVVLGSYEYLGTDFYEGWYDKNTRRVGESDPFTDNTVIFTVELSSASSGTITADKGKNLKNGYVYSFFTFSEHGTTAAALQVIED